MTTDSHRNMNDDSIVFMVVKAMMGNVKDWQVRKLIRFVQLNTEIPAVQAAMDVIDEVRGSSDSCK